MVRRLLIAVASLVAEPEAISKTRIQVHMMDLGGDPRKHLQASQQVRHDRAGGQ